MITLLVQWVDETYQVIGDNYQSLIGYYQSFIDQHFDQSNSEQTNEESENAQLI